MCIETSDIGEASNIYYNYKNIIVPKIKLLDVFIKSSIDINNIQDFKEQNKIKNKNFKDIISIFEIEESYLNLILKSLNKDYIDKDIIFYLILNTDSYIAYIIKREIFCGSPYLYTPYQISYIYEIDYIKVINAFELLGLEKVKSSEIELVLINIK